MIQFKNYSYYCFVKIAIISNYNFKHDATAKKRPDQTTWYNSFYTFHTKNGDRQIKYAMLGF